MEIREPDGSIFTLVDGMVNGIIKDPLAPTICAGQQTGFRCFFYNPEFKPQYTKWEDRIERHD
jgi:hypothetical protein